MLSLIIDRVGNVNIFNLLDGNIPGEESHIQSTIDDDLILEYIQEVERLVKVSQAVLSHPNQVVNADILQDLRIIGETFFRQFFPESIIQRLKNTQRKSIHFNIDPSLALVPWELLHDGHSFLSDRFRMGKTIRGGVHKSPHRPNQKIKMLIIADPTEDLPGAQKEGEMLFSILSQKVSSQTLELEFIGGRQVTKLKLLSLIKDKHIIHYSGHLFFSEDPQENGWLLSDEKVLKAREIKSSGISTDLVFSNACMSAKSSGKKINTDILNQHAGAFLTAGIKSYIGTNWEILDNERTIDFAVRFYTHLFNKKSAGESLFLAKEFARLNYQSNDLTWANYVLFGSPDFALISEQSAILPTQKYFDPKVVCDKFPTPIAQAYYRYISNQKSNVNEKEILISAIQVFEAFSQVVGMIVFSDVKYHSMNKTIPDNLDDALDLRKWWELVYSCIWEFQKLKISTFLEGISERLNHQKETIFKIVHWLEHWEEKPLHKEEFESYLIIFQYFIDNLLFELKDLEQINIFLMADSGQSHYFFRGNKPSFHFQHKDIHSEKLASLLEQYRGNLILLHEEKKRIIPFATYFKEKKESGELGLVFNGLLPVLVEKSLS
ncbi:hypothetical protein LPTSP4_32980 [Leptospira ryugenii]|uniref:CHAT domain-containing protein n=1 Tax=Leptospira ryugenii TaxID=1917863 RepID=A0A2P2E4F5_9LEPT|nr:CHAT domain-containing protein [Leptospira ryugenii]GBF51760.1 hypothetical protein LPTSP4_32980 [Leptospira ryugenii]